MRRLFLLGLFLAIAGAIATIPAAAQYTSVTGTVTDPQGFPYAGGTIRGTLLTPGGPTPTLQGTPVTGQLGPVTLDGNGAFTLYRVPDNNVIVPGGTQWMFFVCNLPVPPPLGTGSQCFTSPAVTITGATQNISATLNAIAPNQVRPLPTAGAITVFGRSPPITAQTGDYTAAQVTNAADKTADQIFTAAQRFKAGPLYDVTAFGASGSLQQTTCTTTAGSAIVTVASAIDFKATHGIIINSAGTGNAPFAAVINVVNGTTLTLNANVPQSVTTQPCGHDDVVAINLAETTAAAVLPTPASVWFPCGSYVIASQPWYVNSATGRVPQLGATKECVQFVKSPALGAFGYDGPQGVITATALAVNPITGAALLTGSGGSFNLNSNTTWFDLRDGRFTAELNGLGAFTVEFRVNIAALPGNFGVFFSSSGQRDSVDGQRTAARLGVFSNGQLEGRLKVGSTTFVLTSATGAMTTATNYDVALAYDGSNIRLFLNGVVQQTTAATGTITQALTEMVRLGPEASWFSEQNGVLTNPVNARIDGVRLSNISRYGAGGYTPTGAKWGSTADANTLVQLNFDNQPAGTNFTVGQTGSGDGGKPNVPVYLPLHNGCPPPMPFSISQMNFGGNNQLYLETGGQNSEMKDVAFNAVVLAGCGFMADFRDINISANGRFGLFSSGGIGRVEHVNVAGNAAYPMFFWGPSGVFEDILLGVTQGNVIPISFVGAGTTGPNPKIKFITMDWENADTAYETGMLLDQLNTATVENSFLVANGGTTQRPVTVQGGTAITFLGNEFATSPSGVSIIRVTSAPTQPISFINNRQNSGKPWTDLPGISTRIGDLININGPKGTPGPANGGDFPFAFDATVFPIVIEMPNEGTTGSFAGTVAKPTGAPSTAIVTASTDTRGALGCVVAGGGITGSAQIAVLGQANCVSDNATVAGDYLTLSATQPGAVHDAGSGYPTSGQVIGRVLATAALNSPLTSANASCPGTGGTYAAGTYQVSVTGVNLAGQETLVARTTVTCSGTTSQITAAPGGYGTSGQPPGYRVYISAAGGSAGTETRQTHNSVTCNDGGAALASTVLTTPTGNACSTFIGAFRNNAQVTSGAAIPSANNAGPAVNTFLYPFDISGGTGAGISRWDQLTNAQNPLTLANAAFGTTFNQTSAAAWTWANTTTATSGTCQSSPIFNWNGQYWNGSASAADSFTLQNVCTNGTNGPATLTFGHSGSSGNITAAYNFPGAGIMNLAAGAANPVAAASVAIMAPASVPTPWRIVLPGAPAVGFFRSTAAIDPSAVTIVPASGVGACPAGQVVIGLNDNGAPTCGQRRKAYFEAAGCSAGTASAAWDSAQPVACNIGTNIYEGVMQFTATTHTAQFKIPLPSDWSGAIDARLSFYDSATSGTVTWTIATACTAGGAGVTDDTAFNTASAFGAITLTTPANALFTATVTGITVTGCTAGNWIQFRIGLSAVTGTANARGIELTL